ncbi:MAG: sulfatase-like hydrolase/transferase, partial [Planctomycetota bacterium]
MRPNLLIVMVDQMQAQLLDPDSPAALPLPNLEALRARSTRFTHAFCPAPICTPTRASFQLSCGVDRHGVIGNDRPMPADIPTLPERLRAVGYATGYVGKWHLDPDNPRGWQTLDDAYPKPGFDPGFDFGKHVMAGIDAP